MATQTFWVVMGTAGLSTFPHRHLSRSSAFQEAERLCRLHGGAFFVLQAVGTSERVDVKTESFDGDIPF